MWNVPDLECSESFMFGMWDVPDRVFGMKDVRNVGCSSSGMFRM